VFENIVFIELRRRGIKPFYIQGEQEIDFYWEGGQLINVCYDYSHEKTWKREINGLFEAMNSFGINESRLISWDQDEIIEKDGKRIIAEPFWRFALRP